MWRPFADDFTTADTENKIAYMKRNQEKSVNQTREYLDPTHPDHPSTVAHLSWNTKGENIATRASRLLQRETANQNTAQPDTVVTAYTDRAFWGIFLSRPPRLSGARWVHAERPYASRVSCRLQWGVPPRPMLRSPSLQGGP